MRAFCGAETTTQKRTCVDRVIAMAMVCTMEIAHVLQKVGLLVHTEDEANRAGSTCTCRPVNNNPITNLASQPGWWALPAVQSGQVYIVDPARLSTPGPRVVEGVEVLSRILHPDLVEHKAPPGSVLKLWLDHGQRCRPRRRRRPRIRPSNLAPRQPGPCSETRACPLPPPSTSLTPPPGTALALLPACRLRHPRLRPPRLR